jgi:hypothetical protein
MSESFRTAWSAAARRHRHRHSRSGRVSVAGVDRLLEAVALDMAGGDRRRLRWISPSTVIVLNRPRGDRR